MVTDKQLADLERFVRVIVANPGVHVPPVCKDGAIHVDPKLFLDLITEVRRLRVADRPTLIEGQ